jgi:hypothetical protein
MERQAEEAPLTLGDHRGAQIEVGRLGQAGVVDQAQEATLLDHDDAAIAHRAGDTDRPIQPGRHRHQLDPLAGARVTRGHGGVDAGVDRRCSVVPGATAAAATERGRRHHHGASANDHGMMIGRTRPSWVTTYSSPRASAATWVIEPTEAMT